MLFIIAPNPIIPSFITIKYFDEESTTSNKIVFRTYYCISHVATFPYFPRRAIPRGPGGSGFFIAGRGLASTQRFPSNNSILMIWR
jgi:hypothetical protein